jgi:hypothetical protein
MATKFLIICSDSNLQFAIREALGSAADLVAIDAESAFRDPQIRRLHLTRFCCSTRSCRVVPMVR